jgi:DNA invertase Pin-like site-specific DNA recombinase
MTGQRIGYKRVSTVVQSTTRQLDGIPINKMFEDKLSGKDRERPQLQAGLDFCREGDTLVVHSMDRLARNLMDLCQLVKELTSKGVAVEFVKEHLTFNGTDDKYATLQLQLMGAFAQFERAIILERQREGIANAKAEGVYKGRKLALTDAEAEELNRRATLPGVDRSALAAEFNISRQTLYTYLKRRTSNVGGPMQGA